MSDKIQKIISAHGLASRRQAEEMISAGRVSCNGTVCRLGDRADAMTDVICVDGTPIPSRSKNIYIMLHKPRGYVTTLSDERGRKNAAQLVADCGTRVYPVGRLDMDSEGLLLFTNDGAFANRLMHPSHQVEKEYRVTVRGFTEKALQALKMPIELDGYQIQPPQISVIESTGAGRAVISVVIHEGRNRQVRRMCAAAGMEVMRLVRVREGDICLGTLKCGIWRYLTEEEAEKLRG